MFSPRILLAAGFAILIAATAETTHAGVRGSNYIATVIWEHGNEYEDCFQYREDGKFVTNNGQGTYTEFDLVIISIVRGHYDQRGQFVNLQGLSVGGGALVFLFGQNVSTFELVNAFGYRGDCP